MDAAYTGAEIARHRKSLGITQKELAAKLHVTDKAVSKWERGINFPDLGILESLAKALETTPVQLLGLEHTEQNAIVTSLAEVSAEQLEDAQKEHARTGWGCLVMAAILILAYQLFGGKDVVSKQRAYQLLHCVIVVLPVYGVYLLFKYEQIRAFGIRDLFIFYSAGFSILIFLLIQLMTGDNPPDWLAFCLIAIASSSIQLLFYRIMRPKLAKALPAIAVTLYTLWRGYLGFEFTLCTICCILTWILCFCRSKKQRVGQ